MNVNYNNLYGDYIGATGAYSISDYIDITSNTLAINSSNFTSGTSNILNDKIFITSNTLNDRIYNVDYKYNNLINEKIENSLINTYIYNSNLGGEIRFYNKKPIGLNRPDYSVRINSSGYLEIYYNYNALINAIEQDGYKNVVNEIISSKASINLLGGFIGTLQLETAGIIGYLIKNRPQNEVGELLEAPAFDRTSTYTAITTGINAIGVRLQNFLFNNRYALFLGSPIAPIIFSFAQYGASVDASHIIAGAIINQYDSNTTMTPQQKEDLLTYGSNLYVNKVYDSLNNLSNINVSLGFINSNIQTQQYINNLKSNTITLNNKPITKFSLDNLDDWIKTPNGIYYDITNGTIAINSTPTTIDYFRVGGQTTIQGDLICEKKLKIDNVNVGIPALGIPATGINGGTGDRFILYSGSASIYPYSFGLDFASLWYSVPIDSSHIFYVNGSPITTISSSGLSTTGTITATTFSGSGASLNNIPFSALTGTTPYLKLDGTNTMTGTLNGTTINASTNLQENAVNLSAKYLLRTGGAMTGQITGITTLNASTILSSTIATTNNGNLGIPAVGAAGGTGDRFIVWNGSASVYPYSLGMNSSTLWYSVPTGASHIFYVNGSAIATISSTGLSTTGISNTGAIRTGGLSAVNGAYELIIGPPSSTTGARLQTVQQGVGYNQNIILQELGGNVGIGTTNTSSYKLYVNGNAYINGTLNAFTNLQENAVNLSAKYLQLAGGIMTGGLRTPGVSVGDGTWQLNISPPSSTTGATFQTIQQGVGFNQNIILQATGGYVGIGTTNTSSYKLYVNGNTYINGTLNASTILSSTIATTGAIRAGGLGAVNGAYELIIGPPSSTTGASLQTVQQGVGYNQNLILQELGGNIGIGTTNTSSYKLCVKGNININNGGLNLATEGYSISSPQYYCTGQTLSYIVNWSGTAESGWFYPLNGYWYPSGHAYLTVAIYAMNVSGSNAYCWFGRIFLSSYNNGTPPAPNGGAILITTDYRNPASYSPNNNYISVTDLFDGTGNNALKITIANSIFAGSIHIKVYG